MIQRFSGFFSAALMLLVVAAVVFLSPRVPQTMGNGLGTIVPAGFHPDRPDFRRRLCLAGSEFMFIRSHIHVRNILGKYVSKKTLKNLFLRLLAVRAITQTLPLGPTYYNIQRCYTNTNSNMLQNTEICLTAIHFIITVRFCMRKVQVNFSDFDI